MINKKILNNLIVLNNNKINNYTLKNDFQSIEKHQIISSILDDETAFEKMDLGIAINILIDILDDEKMAYETYKKLIS